jgi:alpha-N-arabinofuranosidase
MKVIASTVALTNRPGTSGGDYHQYTRPDYFVSQYNFFDQFPTAHDTLIGEYAHVQPNSRTLVGTDWNAPKLPYPIWIGTVSEAIFLIGAERNTDHIIGASFAPLLQNMNSYEWSVSDQAFRMIVCIILLTLSSLI